MKEDLPVGWTMARVGQLGEVQLGKMLDRAKNSGTSAPYLRNINVRWFGFDLTDLKTVLVSPDEQERFSVLDGDLFICEGGEPGRAGVWRNGKSDLVYQKALHRFRTNGSILSDLLMYRFRLDAEVGSLHQSFSGSTIKHFTKESLVKYQIPLAPLPEQKRIADKLEAVLGRVDACRTRLDHVPALLKRFRQSVLAAATSGKLTEEWRAENGVDDEWKNVELAHVADDFSYGTSSKSEKTGNVAVLRMGNIQDGKLDWEGLVYTSDNAEISKYRLSKGDVLFNRTNSPELVGKTCVFDGKHEAIHAGYLIRVKCSDRLIPEFLNYCLNSPEGKDYCWRVKTDGVSQSNINAKKLAALPMLLPSLPEQTEIVRRVEALFAFADRIEARLSAAQTTVARLTPATLAKAFRGELVPQDPDDEPAAAVLERLRPEPFTAPVKGRRTRRT